MSIFPLTEPIHRQSHSPCMGRLSKLLNTEKFVHSLTEVEASIFA